MCFTIEDVGEMARAKLAEARDVERLILQRPNANFWCNVYLDSVTGPFDFRHEAVHDLLARRNRYVGSILTSFLHGRREDFGADLSGDPESIRTDSAQGAAFAFHVYNG